MVMDSYSIAGWRKTTWSDHQYVFYSNRPQNDTLSIHVAL